MTRRDLSSQPAAPGDRGPTTPVHHQPVSVRTNPAASRTFVRTNRRKDPMTTPTNTGWQRPTPTIPPGRFTPPGGPAATAPPTNARPATSGLVEPARRRGPGDTVTRTYRTPHGPEHVSPLTPQEDQMQTLHRPRWSHGCGNPPVPWSWQATAVTVASSASIAASACASSRSAVTATPATAITAPTRAWTVKRFSRPRSGRANTRPHRSRRMSAGEGKPEERSPR